MSTNENFEREFEAFLSDQKESSLESIYRKLPHPAPEIALDKAVLARARQALTDNSKIEIARRHRSIYARHRWVMALGSAAGVVLAAGLAWRVSTESWNKPTSLPLPAVSLPAGAPVSVEEVVNIDLKKEASLSQQDAIEKDKKQIVKENSSELALNKSQMPTNVAPSPAKKGIISPNKNNEKHIIREYISPILSPEKNHPFSAPSALAEERVDTETKTKADTSASLADRMEEPQPFPTQSVSPSDEKIPPTPATGRFADEAKLAQDTRAPLEKPSSPKPRNPHMQGARAKRSELGSAAVETSVAPSVAAPAPPMVSGGSSLISAKQAQKKQDEAERQSSSPSIKDKIQVKEPKPWIASIRKLLRDRRTDEAIENLHAFRKSYPDYQLPPDLRKLTK